MRFPRSREQIIAATLIKNFAHPQKDATPWQDDSSATWSPVFYRVKMSDAFCGLDLLELSLHTQSCEMRTLGGGARSNYSQVVSAKLTLRREKNAAIRISVLQRIPSSF